MLLKCSKDYEKKRIVVGTALKDAVGVTNSASREIAIHREYMSRTKEELKTLRSISWVSFGFLIINSALLGYIVWLLNGGF